MKKPTVAALAFLAVLSLALPAPATAVTYFATKGDIPTAASLGGPFRWNALATWTIGSTSHYENPCMLFLYTIGSGGPNGYYEFPSDVLLQGGQGVAADWCRGLSAGQRICIDGHVNSTPDTYGQTYVIEHASTCP